MTHTRTPLFVALLAVVAVASGCGDDSASSTPTSTLPPVTAPPTTTPASASPDGSWRAVSGTIGGAAVTLIDGSDITLDVDGAEIGGTSACNSYGGTATIADGKISVGELAVTEMACTADGVMELEQVYLSSLGDGTYTVDGDTLTLTFGDDVWEFERTA